MCEQIALSMRISLSLARPLKTFGSSCLRMAASSMGCPGAGAVTGAELEAVPADELRD